MKLPTENSLSRAFKRAFNNLNNDDRMTASASSAGFIIPDGQKRGKRTGFQVFVKVCRYSEELLKSNPETGGLL